MRTGSAEVVPFWSRLMAVSRQTAFLFNQSSIQSSIWLLSIVSSEGCWLMLYLLFLSYEVANRTLQDVCSSTLKRQDTLHYDTLKQEQERTERPWLNSITLMCFTREEMSGTNGGRSITRSSPISPVRTSKEHT